jgi:ribosomal protein L11 methyltransferase
MTTGGLVRLGIRVRREQAEIALAALMPILQAGAEETRPGPDEIEYAVYAPRAELPALDDVRSLAGDALVGLTLSDVPPGWERRWHEHLRPVEVAGAGRRLRIRPPREPAGGDPDVLDVMIEPGELFGAGTHPTTQLCLTLLLELAAARRPGEPLGPLCDWGAGTGILAVCAARLGFAPVHAVEVMPDGLEAIARNAAANGVAVRTHWLNLAATPAPWAPTVTANLTLELLGAIAADALGRPPERMIVSGVLAERAGEIEAAFARHGLHESDRRVQGEWAAVVLAGPASAAGGRA